MTKDATSQGNFLAWGGCLHPSVEDIPKILQMGRIQKLIIFLSSTIGKIS
jgi:hypothetical protein